MFFAKFYDNDIGNSLKMHYIQLKKFRRKGRIFFYNNSLSICFRPIGAVARLEQSIVVDVLSTQLHVPVTYLAFWITGPCWSLVEVQ